MWALICLMTVGLIFCSAKARADSGNKESLETAEGNLSPAHDANNPANEVISKSKDASLEVEIQQLRDLVQSQAQELGQSHDARHVRCVAGADDGRGPTVEAGEEYSAHVIIPGILRADRLAFQAAKGGGDLEI